MNTMSFIPAGFQSDPDSSDEEKCSSNNQNKAQGIPGKKRTIKRKIQFSPEKSENKPIKKESKKKKAPKTSKNPKVLTKEIQKISPEHRPWNDRTVIPIASFDTTRTNGIIPKQNEINRMIENVRKWVLEAQNEKEEAIQEEVDDCFAFFAEHARKAKENNYPVPTRADAEVDEEDVVSEDEDEEVSEDEDNSEIDSKEELESESDIDGNCEEEEDEESFNDSNSTETNEEAEISGESLECEIPDEVDPIQMEYFAPLGNTIRGKDVTQLRNVPLLYHDTDDIAVCSEFYKMYPSGIRGYEPNAYEISEQLLFEIMKKALPNTTSADSELLYYALYRLFPNFGSQKEMSQMFPKLVKLFAKDDDESDFLLSWEPWKSGREEYEEEDEEKPIDWKHSCSIDNFFVKSIRLPNQEEERDFCSDECYKSMYLDDLIDIIGELPHNYILELNISKKVKSKPESLFLDSLVLKDENRYIVDFCGVVRQFRRRHNNNRTCLEWFEILLDIANNLDETRKHERTFTEKHLSFSKLLAREKIKDTIFAISPCYHFGPCGPNAENCSCDLFCSVYCQCDDDCVRKFPGCLCAPNLCKTKRCPCRAIGWECIEETCGKCHSNPIKCPNSCASRIEDKEVSVGRSEIAGNGLFLEEDVEKGDYLGIYVGEFISADESERRGKLSYFGNNYLFGLPNCYESIDSSRVGNHWRFGNHADEPNCSFEYSVVQGLPAIKFYATKAMKAGEELTISYGNPDSVKQFLHDSALEDRLPKWKDPAIVVQKVKTEKDLKKRVSSKKKKIQKRVKVEEFLPDVDYNANKPSCSSDVITSCQFVYKGFANDEDDDESGYSD